MEIFGDTRVIETADLEVALVELNESISLWLPLRDRAQVFYRTHLESIS